MLWSILYQLLISSFNGKVNVKIQHLNKNVVLLQGYMVLDKEIKEFKISDLMKPKKNTADSLKKRTLISKKYNRNKDNVKMEVSSFKMSNKMSVVGRSTKKKKHTTENKSDILWYHEEKLDYFKDLKLQLGKKKLKLKKLKKKGGEMEILRLEKEINYMESGKEENDYHNSTRKIIEKYTLLCNSEGCDTKKDDTGDKNILKFVEKYDNKEKEILAEEYCKITNNGKMINTKNLENNNRDICEECNGETRYIENYVTCMDCGFISNNSVSDYQISYKDLCDTMIKKNYEYKRPNRFKEILATLQAKENTEIPKFVVDAVEQEISKEYNVDIFKINVKKMKEYLKRLSLTQYYEHAPRILEALNGIAPLSIPGYIEDKLLHMFDAIQEPFEIVKVQVASTRLSFLSYNYVLFKFCELLDLDEYKKHFTLLKSHDKLRVQDKIWKGMCEILGWEYIPSI
jgi:hypothetical protein